MYSLVCDPSMQLLVAYLGGTLLCIIALRTTADTDCFAAAHWYLVSFHCNLSQPVADLKSQLQIAGGITVLIASLWMSPAVVNKALGVIESLLSDSLPAEVVQSAATIMLRMKAVDTLADRLSPDFLADKLNQDIAGQQQLLLLWCTVLCCAVMQHAVLSCAVLCCNAVAVRA